MAPSPLARYLAAAPPAPNAPPAGVFSSRFTEASAIAALRGALEPAAPPPARATALANALPNPLVDVRHAFEAFAAAGLVPPSYADGDFPRLRGEGPFAGSSPEFDVRDTSEAWLASVALTLAADPGAVAQVRETAEVFYHAMARVRAHMRRHAVAHEPSLAAYAEPDVSFACVERWQILAGPWTLLPRSQYSGRGGWGGASYSHARDLIDAAPREVTSPSLGWWPVGWTLSTGAAYVLDHALRPGLAWAALAERGVRLPGAGTWADLPNPFAPLAALLAQGACLQVMDFESGAIHVLMPVVDLDHPNEWLFTTRSGGPVPTVL